MKDKEKPEAIITINGLDPIQWQEEKEGRVAILFVSEPVIRVVSMGVLWVMVIEWRQ